MSTAGRPRRVPPRPPDPRTFPKRWKAAFCHTSSSFSDVTRTSLLALSQSAEAFPPLKSACGGVLAIWDTAERVKGVRTNAMALALRCYEILNVVADSVPDPSVLSPEMKAGLARFNDLLNEIRTALDLIQKQKWTRRLIHLNSHQDQLQRFTQRLDEARQDLITLATLRTHCVAEATSRQCSDISVKLSLIENHVKLTPPMQSLKAGPQDAFVVSVVLF